MPDRRNLNDDEFVDILDFGVLMSQWFTAVNPQPPCGTPPPYYSDIDGDGLVNLADFTFIRNNFLQGSESCCLGADGLGSHQPVTRIAVSELQKLGLGQLAIGDLNHDGWLDEADISAFLAGARPHPTAGSANPGRQ